MWKNCSFTFFQKLHAAAQNASCKLPVSSCCLHRSVCRDLFIRTLQRRALTHLAQSLGIAKSEIACIGDGENDLSMFEASGMKLAMGNAVEMLKKEADYILPDCDHNGVTEGAALLEMMTT